MFASFGPLEIGLILLIVLVIFGPKRLPGLGKQLGKGMREFKESIGGDSKDEHDDEAGARAQRSELAAAPAEAAAAPGRTEAGAAAPETTAPVGARSGDGERPNAGPAPDSRG